MRSSEKLGLEAVAAVSAWVEPGLEMARVELKQSGGEEWGRLGAQADTEDVGLALTSLRPLRDLRAVSKVFFYFLAMRQGRQSCVVQFLPSLNFPRGL